MRIIKEGKIPIIKEKEYRVKCKNCKTKFAFYEKEATYINRGTHKRIECPLCGLSYYL